MNIWTQFKSIIAGDPLLIGTVTAIDTDAQTSRIELLEGGQVTVRGTSVAVGAKAFIRGSLLESPAPNLPTVHVEL